MPASIQSLRLPCPAKINLTLAVLGRREDGFHNLHSIVCQTEFGDFLELNWDPEGTPANDQVSISGLELSAEDNTVIRAIRLFRSASLLDWGSIKVNLNKQIPSGAGLGGGSSDAVATLKALSQLTEIPDSGPDLISLSTHIGSDCPLFFHDLPVLMEGRGERITPLEDDLAVGLHNREIILFKPAFGIETPLAYARLAAAGCYTDTSLASLRLAEWRGGPQSLPGPLNSFELLLPDWIPSLAIVLKRLRDVHGLDVRLSGSGSACFAFAEDVASVRNLVRNEVEQAWGISCFLTVTTLK